MAYASDGNTLTFGCSTGTISIARAVYQTIDGSCSRDVTSLGIITTNNGKTPGTVAVAAAGMSACLSTSGINKLTIYYNCDGSG